MDLNCRVLKQKYESLKTKQENFTSALAKKDKPYDMTELKRLKKELEQARDEVMDMLTVKEIKATTPEGIEVCFEIKEQLEYWKKFYKDEGVDWATLPEDIWVTKMQEKEIKRLITELGFDKMLIIPEGLADTGEKYEKLHKAMTKEYNETGQLDDFKQDGGFAKLVNKSNKLRIIITKEVKELNENEIFRQTLDKSPNYLEKSIFKEKNVRGMDMATYLVLQREYYKAQNGQHIDGGRNFIWLTEVGWLARTPTRPAHAAARTMSDRVPFVFWCPEGSSLSISSLISVCSLGSIGCRLAGSFEVG